MDPVWRSQPGGASLAVSLPACQPGWEELLCGLFQCPVVWRETNSTRRQMHSGQCTVHSGCTVVAQWHSGTVAQWHSGQCTVHSGCTVVAQWLTVAWNTTRLLYRERSSTIRIHQTVYSVKCTVDSAQCTVHGAQCTVDVQWMQHRGVATWNTTRLLYRRPRSTGVHSASVSSAS